MMTSFQYYIVPPILPKISIAGPEQNTSEDDLLDQTWAISRHLNSTEKKDDKFDYAERQPVSLRVER